MAIALDIAMARAMTSSLFIKGLEIQRLIGSAVAGFNHARTITKAPAKGWTRDKMIITKEYAPLGA